MLQRAHCVCAARGMDLKGVTLNTGVSWMTGAIYHLSHKDSMD